MVEAMSQRFGLRANNSKEVVVNQRATIEVVGRLTAVLYLMEIPIFITRADAVP